MGGGTPEPPDYGAAYEKAIQADLNTLGIRAAAEKAATEGKVWANGQVFDDMNAYNAFVKGLSKSEQKKYANYADFSGMSDADRVGKLSELMSQANADAALAQADLRGSEYKDGLSLGEWNSAQSAKELEAADPESYAARKQLLEVLQNQDSALPADLQKMAGQVLSRFGVQASQSQELAEQLFGSAGKASPEIEQLLADASAKYALGGKLDDSVRDEVIQSARSGQASRGNILGNASAFAEAMEVGQASELREKERAQTLLQMAGASENLKQQSLANYFAAQNQESTNLGNLFNTQNSISNQSYAREQQALSSLSSYLLGNQVGNQFGGIQGAQYGTVGNYSAINAVPQNQTQVNQGAGMNGVQFALNNYQNQVQYADAKNPWGIVGGLIGAGIGAAAGGGPAGAQVGASTGTAIGGKIGSAF